MLGKKKSDIILGERDEGERDGGREGWGGRGWSYSDETTSTHTPTSPVAVYLPYPVPHYVGQSRVSAASYLQASSTIRL